MNRPILSLLVTLVLASVAFQPLPAAPADPAHNPLIWADVPDIAMIRVGKTYYMSSTTMHMSPGLPIMKSEDLVNWSMASYAYETLADNEALRLENGKNAYGLGSWASSLRFHDGVFYASTFSAITGGRTHIYTTRDPERGPWKETSFTPSLGDHSLFFEDGRVYMVHGGGRIMLTEMQPDLSGIKPGGVNKVIVENVNALFGADQGGLKGEGSQLSKINGRYYLFNIASPGSRWARTVMVHRADSLTGPYEGRIVLDDRGIAQGGLIDTPEGKWYAYLFKDNGAVGRIPYLVPVTWKDGWPVLGVDGKVPMTLDIPASGQGVSGASGIVASDEFDRQPGAPALPLAWQWNHNPDNKLWSVTQRPGFLRLTTGRVDADLPSTRNTLTQRTFGPRSSATTSIDVSGMKDGDCAGLAAFQKRYGFVGVKMSGGARSLVMVSADSDKPEEVASVPLSGETVHLKVECEFQPAPEVARFSYSLDGKSWTPIGRPSQLSYTFPHFMGYRFALFYYSTQTAGGRVDFDYFRIGEGGGSRGPSPRLSAIAAPVPAYRTWAATPPMGWNSWDAFGTTLTETQAKAQADVMAGKLLSHGWNIFTVDIQWYEPASDGFGYRKDAKLSMDDYGRLVPAVEKFPSAANGAGFKPLADYVHAKGLKFGIHVMRGIPRQAVKENTPILGSNVRAADIAITSNICMWNPDMFGVDATKPGGQAYYDSLMALYASWGVDFIKVDDLSRPYDDVQLAEVEAIRRAIDKTGRPIVLSTSPGETPLARGEHVATHANLWRISDDFWDKWPALRSQFKRLHDWTPYRAPGAWPDADMLPLGIIERGRSTRFTPDEQRTMMTLWSIARSPLILGADMTQLDEATLALLTNDEVLAVNQASAGNHQLFEKGDLIAWIADVTGSKDKYLAVFNTGDAPAPVPVELSAVGFTGDVAVRDLWARRTQDDVRDTFAPVVPAHGSALYRLRAR